MIISQRGIDLIKQFEGCRLKAYLCPSGVPTIGYGHTKGVKLGQLITQQQAEQYLKQDLKVYEDHVKRIVKLELNQNQFDALVSFCYNCGAGNLQTLVKNRTLTQISNALLLYNKSNGKVLKGLQKRRIAEQQLFQTPITKNIRKVKVTAVGLNVRDGIGTTYKIVKVLKKNDVVVIQEELNNWGKISDGWISLKYTKEV